MNMRNMLLVGLLFVAPCLTVSANGTDATAKIVGDSNPPAPAPADPLANPAVKKTGLGATMAVPFVFMGEKVLEGIDFAAIPVTYFLKMTTISESNVKTIGRVVVSAAFAVAMYKAYQAWLDAQNDDTDEDTIFVGDNV